MQTYDFVLHFHMMLNCLHAVEIQAFGIAACKIMFFYSRDKRCVMKRCDKDAPYPMACQSTIKMVVWSLPLIDAVIELNNLVLN